MNWRIVVLAMLTSLLLPLVPAAQETADPEKSATVRDASAKRSPRGQMYEDVEIMRRLLNGKLQGFAPQNNTMFLAGSNAACTNCHGPATGGNIYGMIDPSGAARLLGQHPLLNQSDLGLDPLLHAWNRNRFATQNRLLVTNPHPWVIASPARSRDAEGIYLNGQGVVFTMTLPPPERDPRPEPPKPAPKPPSEWERIRKEVRQEKPRAEETAKPPKEPTLSDVILKVMAENGRHFAQLGENESLTVVVTFRTPEPTAGSGMGVALADFDGDGFLDITVAAGVDPAAVPKPQPAKEDKPAAKPAAEDGNHKKVKDLTLLGELQLKQGKTEEAIKALRQALELKPEGEQAAAVNRHLAEALIAAQKYEEAVQALQKAVEWQKKQQAKPAPKAETTNAPQPTPLPGKLIITASKKLLDAVGSGKMTFEEFTKAASVEYVTFPAERK